MKWWNQLPQQQRTAITIGAPLVAAIVLFQSVRRPAAAPVDEGSGAVAGTIVGTGAVDGWTVSTDAIGVGQLADFESGVSNALIGLTRTINDQVDKSATTPPAAVKPPATPPAVLIGGQIPDGDPNKGKRTTKVHRLASGKTETLQIISARVYRDERFWPQLVWWNFNVLPKGVTGTRELTTGTTIKY